MGARYLAELLSDPVRAAQERHYGRSLSLPAGAAGAREPLGEAEREFIGLRDSFYLATVTPDGWPYLQHRGGPPGFLRVVAPDSLAYADLRGNRQLISIGNLDNDARVSLLLMDYPNRARLKILGRARVLDARDEPALAEAITPPSLLRKVERIVRIEIVGFDWNCPSNITPRYTEEEIREAMRRHPGWLSR